MNSWNIFERQRFESIDNNEWLDGWREHFTKIYNPNKIRLEHGRHNFALMCLVVITVKT